MSLGKKIVLSFVFLSVLLGGLGILWEVYYEKIINEQLKESREASLLVEYTNSMEISLYQSLLYLNSIREVTQIPDKELEIRITPTTALLTDGFNEETQKFNMAFDTLEVILGKNPPFFNEISELRNRFLLYISLSNEWLGLVKEDNGLANEMFMSSLEPYFRTHIMPKVSEIRKKAVARQEEKIKDLDDELSLARKANLIASSLALLLGFLLALYIYNSIARPLKGLTKAVNKLGEGDLKFRIDKISKDEFGQLASAFNEMAHNLETKTISVDYLDNLLESIEEAIFVADEEGNVTKVNSAAAEMLDYSRNKLLGKKLKNFFYLTDMKEGNNQSLNKKFSKEYNLVTSKNIQIPILFSQADLIENGVKKGTVNVASDISELKAAELELKVALQEKGLMLAEIHHRVKNNLAVISGLLQLQSFQSDNEEVSKALTDSQYRVQSIALVHEMLYQSESLAYINYDQYVKDLMQNIRAMHLSEHKDIELIAEVEPFSLNINQAISCSLLINEVLVNSFKHAFTDQDSGFIKVQAREVDGSIIINISDDGKGVNNEDFYKSSSLGATLIKTLTSQLYGTFEVQELPEGEGSMFVFSFEKESTE